MEKEKIYYQSVCFNGTKCDYVAAGKKCEHAVPLRRKGYEKERFQCPYENTQLTYIIAKCSCRKNEYIRWKVVCHPSSINFASKEKKQELCKKFNKCYGFFRRSYETGKLEGYCENSFSMGYSPTRVSPSSLAYVQNELQKRRKTKDLEYEYFIVRLTATGKRNPVTIDWNAEKNKKYEWRNIPFYEKEPRLEEAVI